MNQPITVTPEQAIQNLRGLLYHPSLRGFNFLELKAAEESLNVVEGIVAAFIQERNIDKPKIDQ